MKNRKTLKTMMLFSVIFAGGISLASCNNGDKTSEEDFIFELTGNGEIAGVNYNFDLKGVEADNEFYISVRDTEIENIWGEWKFVDGKGYILTF